jgi:nicotinamide riboside kinase
LKNKTKTIVITGAESTGKSALTEYLASYFNAPAIPEFARKYVENLNKKYTYNDVEIIARRQIFQLKELKKQNHEYIFSDTWLIITKIWFEEVFGQLPSWIESEIHQSDIDLFIVCDIDLPWIPDNVRENGGEKRIYLQNKYIENIIHYNFPYQIVNGLNKTRFQNAVKMVQQLTT